MKHILLSAVCAMSLSAQAEVFTCFFTEPFFETTYDTNTQELTVQQDFSEKPPAPAVTKNVKFVVVEIKNPDKPSEYVTGFELRSPRGITLMRITHSNAGTDGMSDTVYPFDGEALFQTNGYYNFGGCESSTLKAKVIN